MGSLSFTPASRGDPGGPSRTHAESGPCVQDSQLLTWCLGQGPHPHMAGIPHARETQPRNQWCLPEVLPQSLSPTEAPVSSARCAFSPRLVFKPERPFGEGDLCFKRQAGARLGVSLAPCCPHACPLALQARLPHSHRQQKSSQSVDGKGSLLCPHVHG